MSVQLNVAGRTFHVPPSSSQVPSVLLVGLPKSGTTLLTKVFARACRCVGAVHLDMHGEMFRAGIDEAQLPRDEVDRLFVPTGYCFGAFRHAFEFLRAPAGRLTTIWIRRDPRDVIVSRYFSEAWAHELPGGAHREQYTEQRRTVQQLNPDEFALAEVERQVALIRTYLDVFATSQPLVYWYRDLIYDKAAWIAQMMRDCGWPLSPEQIATITREVDEIPAREDPQAFVRQVHPGNHTRHLQPATIAALEACLASLGGSWRRP